ncbi:MAG: PAS domain S-box protein [Rhizobium sp.]|nr:PAS domain S-box protein [Rhizobium sp.]
MASRVEGIGPSPRLLMLCFLPLAALIVGMGIDQYVRQRAALLTDLAGKANEMHGLISASIDGSGPQPKSLRLSMGLDDYSPPIGTLVVLDAGNAIAGISGQVKDDDRQRLDSFVDRPEFKAASVADTPGLSFDQHSGYRSLTRVFGQTGYKLVYLVPDSDLRAYLFPRFAPFLVILAGLAATVAGIFYFLHRAYILPSLRLARYVSDQASGIPSVVPVLPSAWRKQFGLIANAFSSSRRYQSQLEESEARFLAATASLRDGFAIVAPDGKLAFFNESMTWHLSEDQREQLFLGQDVRQFVDSVWAGGDGVDVERQLEDGRWISGRQSHMPDGGRVILLRDITDAKLAELRLRESEQRYRNVVETQTDLVVRYDGNGFPTFANEAYCRYLGLTLEEMLSRGQSDFDLVIPEDRERHRAYIDSLTPSHPSATILIRCRIPSSEQVRWEEWTDTGIFDANGGLIEIQAIGRDVTEKHMAQEALSTSEARLAGFLNYAPVAMLAKDMNGIFTLANPEALKRLKRTEAEVIGKTTRDLLPANEADEMDRSVARVLETGEMQIEEQIHPSLDPYLYSLFIRFPLRAASGEIDGVGIFVVDQTREKLAELELDQQRSALHQSEKLAALGSLLAGVAHELNNPLSIVVGYAGMLHEMATDEATRRRTRELHSAAERCGRIVKTFLSMARSKPIEKRSVDIDTVIDDVLELAAYGLRSNGITMVRKRSKTLPATLADPDQLHQVFMNVVLNAQQAMMGVNSARSLDVETRFDGTNIAIDISDTGHGVPEDIKKRVFEPFFTTKPQGVGTGIGLSVCLRIVQAHGGTIHLDSNEDGGTICRIRLPVTEVRATAELEGGGPAFVLSGELLVVDDEPAIGRYVSEYLSSEGVVVTAVDSGREAVELLANGAVFDAVLTDLRMPDVSGDKIIDFIAENRPDLEGRVVIMTGDALGPEINTRSRDIPVVVKPLELRALRVALRPILGHDVDGKDKGKDHGREANEDQKENA